MDTTHHDPDPGDTLREAGRPGGLPGKGDRLGEFEVLEPIGHGASTVVYRARDATGHEVALKVFVSRPGDPPNLAERFHREVAATKNLRKHPHILTVYGSGQEPPCHYLVMEYVPGRSTLQDRMGEPMVLEEALRIVVAVGQALQYAHTHRIIHRDVKPANILLDEFGRPRVADFGVAALNALPSVTQQGALVGTPLYMSPEQAAGDKPVPASDLYSLGVIFYQMVTGRVPYPRDHLGSTRDVLRAVREDMPANPERVRSGLPPGFGAAMLWALAKRPDDRPESVAAWLAELEATAKGQGRRTWGGDRWRPGGLVRAGRIAGLALGLGLAGFLLWAGERKVARQAHLETLPRLAQLEDARRRLADPAAFAADGDHHPPGGASIREAWRKTDLGEFDAARRLATEAVEAGDAEHWIPNLHAASRTLARLPDLDPPHLWFREVATAAAAPPAMAEMARLEWAWFGGGEVDQIDERPRAADPPGLRAYREGMLALIGGDREAARRALEAAERLGDARDAEWVRWVRETYAP